MGVSEMKTAAGACQVVTRDLRRQPLSLHQVSVYDSRRRNTNAYYPDFAYRVDVKRKCLQVLSVVGPSKCVQGQQIESASCFNRLQKEGDALCIEEYGKRLGYVYSTSSSTFFTAIFECNFGEDVKWVNPLPFDTGAEDLVMSLARHASEWIAFFQRNISKLQTTNSADHTRLSLVLQLDMINCETWKHASKMPMEVRFQGTDYANQGASKKQKGVRYRHDRGKWVAEFNPPGKKNNKISLGEYDNAMEAARAADAGMFCYGSKRGSYNFDDSQRFLLDAPRPVSDDKEAIRKWARDFARLTSSKNTESMPLASSASSWSDVSGTSRCLTYENNTDVTAGMLQHSNSSISVSNVPSFTSNYALDYNPNVLEYNSDSSSALSFSLEDVADMFTSSRDITSREIPVSIEDFEQGVEIPAQMPAQMPAQINSSPPPQDSIGFPDDSLFRNEGLDQFFCPSPLPGSNSNSRTASDDLFQCFLSCYPGSPSPGSIQLISR